METLIKLNEKLIGLNYIEFRDRKEKLEAEKEVLKNFFKEADNSLQKKINERLQEVENMLQGL